METSKTFFALRKRNSNNLLFDLRNGVSRTIPAKYHFETNFVAVGTTMKHSKLFLHGENVTKKFTF